jgi:pimeloyl-ACP methyl ester carboxylesterase
MNQPFSGFLPGTPRLHYLEWNPAGRPTLVLVHGNCANAWWWRPMADEVAEANLRLLAIDLRGHGDSNWVRPPRYSPMDYAHDIAHLIQTIGVKNATVVGHSMGGIAVVNFALHYQHLVRAAVVIDIAITSGPRRNRYLGRLRTLPTVEYADRATAKAKFRLMPNEGEIPAEVLAQVAERSIQRTTDGRYTMKFDRESFFGSDGLDVAAAIAAVRVPLLLLRGEQSRIMTADAASDAKGSNRWVELVTIPNAHHHLPLEAPAALARTIEHFVRVTATARLTWQRTL